MPASEVYTPLVTVPALPVTLPLIGLLAVARPGWLNGIGRIW